MGKPKLLLPWGETTVLGQTIANVKASNVDDVLLVTGGYWAQVNEIAKRYFVPTVYNPDFATGEMVSSLKSAVSRLNSDGMLVVLGDMPLIEANIINQIIDAYQQLKGQIIAPTFDEKQGHPVLFDASLFSQILALPADSTPRQIMKHNQDKLYKLALQTDTILFDLDTKEAYEEGLGRRANLQ